MKTKSSFLLALPVVFALIGMTPAHAVDADAAKDLFKKEKCNKCHATDKDKTGPSLKSIAAKHKGKADAEAAMIKVITTGPKVKLDDGSEEEHKIIKTKDAGEQKNLVQWMLSH
jgi:cytochrome c